MYLIVNLFCPTSVFRVGISFSFPDHCLLVSTGTSKLDFSTSLVYGLSVISLIPYKYNLMYQNMWENNNCRIMILVTKK